MYTNILTTFVTVTGSAYLFSGRRIKREPGENPGQTTLL